MCARRTSRRSTSATRTCCARRRRNAGAAPGGRGGAIGGGGRAGLTAAGELVKSGHQVTIFEAFHAPGGVLIYGIPEFRLPKDIVQADVDRRKAAGAEVEGNAIAGHTR